MYRLVDNILGKRLSEVVNSLSSLNKTTFLQGVKLVDNDLIMNKVIDLDKKSLFSRLGCSQVAYQLWCI